MKTKNLITVVLMILTISVFGQGACSNAAKTYVDDSIKTNNVNAIKARHVNKAFNMVLTAINCNDSISSKRLADSIALARSIRKVDTIYKKSTSRDLTFFKVNGIEYSFKDSIANLSSYATTLNLADTAAKLRSIRGVDTIYKKSTNRDLTYFKINGVEYSFKDSSGSAASSQTLAQTLSYGNTTDGTNIAISAGDAVVLGNGSLIHDGLDYGLSGNGGVELQCTVGYKLRWEAGVLYVLDGSDLIRVAQYKQSTPGASDDETKRYKVGSLWILDNKDTYICTDATTGNAVWVPYYLGYIPLEGTAVGSPVTGDLEVSEAGENGNMYYHINGTDIYNSIQFSDNGIKLEKRDHVTSDESSFTVRNEGTVIYNNISGSRGLIGTQDFTANITDLDYTQKKYVDDVAGKIIDLGTITYAQLNSAPSGGIGGFAAIVTLSNVIPAGYYISSIFENTTTEFDSTTPISSTIAYAGLTIQGGVPNGAKSVNQLSMNDSYVSVNDELQSIDFYFYYTESAGITRDYTSGELKIKALIKKFPN